MKQMVQQRPSYEQSMSRRELAVWIFGYLLIPAMWSLPFLAVWWA